MTDVVIDSRYCGPRAFANGGYAAGRFAQVIDGPAAVMLKAPAPFDTPIAIASGDGFARRYAATANGAEIALIEPAEVSVSLPPLPPPGAVEAARAAFLSDEGMTLYYPYCFVCGKKCADGLHVFAGPAPGSPVNADFWTPSPALADADGLVRSEFIWAALDCPGAYALRLDGALVLLGRFSVEIMRRPAPGERLLAAAWRTGHEGRKHYADSALVDEAGALVAAANAVWIELNDPALLARLRLENA
jgi:hypothetical protein